MLDTVWVATDIPRIRDNMIETLIKAIMEADLQAKAAPEAADGAVPQKARWYQLIGYLVQVLDGEYSDISVMPQLEKMAVA
jgi:hypothetical protein